MGGVFRGLTHPAKCCRPSRAARVGGGVPGAHAPGKMLSPFQGLPRSVDMTPGMRGGDQGSKRDSPEGTAVFCRGREPPVGGLLIKQALEGRQYRSGTMLSPFQGCARWGGRVPGAYAPGKMLSPFQGSSLHAGLRGHGTASVGMALGTHNGVVRGAGYTGGFTGELRWTARTVEHAHASVGMAPKAWAWHRVPDPFNCPSCRLSCRSSRRGGLCIWR